MASMNGAADRTDAVISADGEIISGNAQVNFHADTGDFDKALKRAGEAVKQLGKAVHPKSRGQPSDIPFLGHKTVRGNPRQRLWDSGASYNKRSWRPSPSEPWTVADLHRLCTTIRTDHPARKS